MRRLHHRCTPVHVNPKENQIRLLCGLKEDVATGRCSAEEAQARLSWIVLQICDSKQTELKAKKLDNDMELIVYTLLTEHQGKAAISVIDEAIAYIRGLARLSSE